MSFENICYFTLIIIYKMFIIISIINAIKLRYVFLYIGIIFTLKSIYPFIFWEQYDLFISLLMFIFSTIYWIKHFTYKNKSI